MGAPTAGLFGTIPSNDYLQFWQAGRFHPQRVARFLNLSKDDVAHLAGIALSSVRFDRKAPHPLVERLTEVAITCTWVAQFFKGDAIRTALWFKTANPSMGEASPRDMIRFGRHDKLRRFVRDALNEPPTASLPRPRAEAKDSAGDEPRPSAPLDFERRLDLPRDQIVRLCRRFGVRRLALFGSILRPDFDPARSDVDLAVEFGPPIGRSPARQYFDFKAALEALFGRPVDLVELSAMPDSRLRRIIERTQVPVYAEAA
ncbi:MAG: nucleotidyltransferase family protein [Steroidobacteraceae bacterium]